MQLNLPASFPALSQDGIAAHIDALCGLGNRFVGTPGETEARRYLRREFSRVGLSEVRAEPVQTLAYEGRSAKCRVIGLDLELPTVAMQFTADAGAEGEAVYLGRPESTEDIESLGSRVAGLAGRVAVLHSPAPWRFANYLVSAGVAGIVSISDAPGRAISHVTAQMFPATAPPAFDGSPLAVPGVTIEREAGLRLLAAMTAGVVRLSVEHRATYRRVTTANLLGEIVGESDHLLVVAAHYDTQREGVGAHDNATGLAALLEMATRWAPLRPKRTVRFVAFCDEEHGLRGASGYCPAHARELPRTSAMIYLDALAWILPGTRTLIGDPGIAAYAAERVNEVGWDPQAVSEAIDPPSDLTPFVLAGVPAVRFLRLPPHSFYHSAGDTPDLLDIEAVTAVANVSAYTAWSIANAPERDVRQRFVAPPNGDREG